MRLITDWHIHSKYSRACSRDLELPKIAAMCERKGIDVAATGDWTHPAWFEHLKTNLIESEPGLYRVGVSPVRFMLVTEVSQIYKKGDKTRRIHNLIFSPSLETCAKVNAELDRRGLNRKSDGRPIFGIESEELYKVLKSIDERIIVIPAHAWTPWYSVFGSKSGFDSIEECFGSMSPYIYAIETGLSSDPKMNWQISILDSVVMISNSDAHSPDKLGREANVFDLDAPSYDEFVRVLREQDRSKFLYTIEFFPEEGKYHLDGCANCLFSSTPAQTKKIGARCPTCKRPLTLGVEYRVNQLADRKAASVSNKIPYKSIVPLKELIADSVGVGVSSKTVSDLYLRLTDRVANEFSLMLDVPIAAIAAEDATVAEAVRRVREGRVHVVPGYDGIFGTIRAFSDDDRPKRAAQPKLL
ncbi:MAG: DNA helicase UvrD [Actinobacteria bacterium]|nr:DNA helicase UvrD [Actinomycetota bacterium]